jgi:hypothetical protein
MDRLNKALDSFTETTIDDKVRRHTLALELARLDGLQETFYARALEGAGGLERWHRLFGRAGSMTSASIRATIANRVEGPWSEGAEGARQAGGDPHHVGAVALRWKIPH